MARDQVRVDRQAQHSQTVVEAVLPHRRVPLRQLLAAPDVVDQHVEAALLGVDALDERLDLRRLQVVDLGRDPGAACGVDELGGLLDRLRPVVLRAPVPRRSTGAVDGRPRLSERDRDAPPGTAGRAGHERHLPCERAGRRHRTSICGVNRPRAPCGALRSSTAPRTSAPPVSCTGLSDSPKARYASTTVVSGSAVERIEAVVGPTRRRPAKNRPTAPTVETTAMPASHP